MKPRRLALAFFLLFWPEAANFLAASSRIPAEARGRCQVLVLGYPAGTIQRYRVRAGVSFFRAQECSALILSGGRPHSASVEAEDMAEIAKQDGVEPRRLVLESASANTWENIRNCLPHLRKGEHVFIVSDALHAARAKAYLCRQSPDLCPTARVAVLYEPFRLFFYKWVSAYYSLARFW